MKWKGDWKWMIVTLNESHLRVNLLEPTNFGTARVNQLIFCIFSHVKNLEAPDFLQK